MGLTEGSNEKPFKWIGHNSGKEDNSVNSEIIGYRTWCTLDTIKWRIWKYKIPLVTEREITKTGPLILKTKEYHNHTFWSRNTSIEMIFKKQIW